jgi:hypothetical protein
MANNSETIEPTLRNTQYRRFDQASQKFLKQTERLERRTQGRKSQEEKGKKQPRGGFDATSIPRAPPGYTLKFTFHRARNLPFADINTLSSDPYVIATLKTNLPKRHEEDPDLELRTPTIHRSTEPEWNTEWVVANVPASGFFLKCRLYDEDPADHDDRLGNVHITVNSIGDSWPGIKEQTFEVKKHVGSKRAYLIRGCVAILSGNLKITGEMTLSVENLGRTPDESGGKAYTVGPLYWYQHFSPLIGRLTGVKDADNETRLDGKKKIRKYKSVPIPQWAVNHILVVDAKIFSPAFKLSKCSSLVPSRTSFTIATSSSSRLSLVCSHHTPFGAASSTVPCIISTHASTTSIALLSTASSKSLALT